MSSSKYTLKLEHEQVDAIIVAELKSMYEDFAPERRPSCGIWHNEPEADLKEMAKMRKALKRVLGYLGETV